MLGVCLAWRTAVAPEARAADPVDAADGTENPANPARPIEEVVVHGDTQPSMDVLAGATATRIETDTRLVEGQQLADVLADVPGVQVRRFGGVGERFEISIRGSRPEQVPVFLDGVRLDTSLTGSSDLSALCLDVLQEVQVVRGPGAARAGTGAIGGVVNLVSRKPTAVPETRLRLSGGNFESVEGSLRHARQIGDWGLSLAYCGFHTQGDFRFQQARRVIDGVPVGNAPTIERINNESDRHTAIAHVERTFGEGELRVTQLVTHLERGVPGSEFDQRPNSEERDISSLTSVTFDTPLVSLPGTSLDFGLSHRFEGDDYRDPDAFIGGDPIDTETDVQNLTARSGARYERDLLAGHHRFSLLGEGRFDERSSNAATRGFCGHCGASLFWQPEGEARIAFAPGSLDGPTGLTTSGHLHVKDAGDYYAPEGPPPVVAAPPKDLTCACLCGAVAFSLPGPTGDIVACHCTQCRKLSGHYAASFDADETALRYMSRKSLAEYETPAGGRRGFCKTCGSSLYFRSVKGEFSIEAGAVTGPTGGQLTEHIFTAFKGDYYMIDDGLPQS